MHVINKLRITASLLVSTQVMAHTSLSATVPAKGAMLMSAPETLELNFTSPVKLIKLTLKDAYGKPVSFGFKPIADPAKHFALPLPQLSVSTYTVNWMVMGKDAHKMKGEFGFMVHEATAMTQHDSKAMMNNSEHKMGDMMSQEGEQNSTRHNHD